MARHIWLLVEWVDEPNVFPSYGVVNVDTLEYNETDLNVGKKILLSVKHGNPRHAQILRISDNKRHVKEHKEILERQDQKVKNVLQLCMRTIKEMKSEPVFLSSLNPQHVTGGQNMIPRVVTATSEISDSDSEPEAISHSDRSRGPHQNKFVKYKHNGVDFNSRHSRSVYNSANRRSVISSTPLPSSSAQENTLLCFDQGTQTDNTFLQPSIDKIEEVEATIKSLYRRFQSLIAQVYVTNHETMYVSESEQNDGEVSCLEPVESWTRRNNTQYVEGEPVVAANMNEAGAESVIEGEVAEQQINNSNVKLEAERDKATKASTLRVRRMSAQTTNNIEPINSHDPDMIPIGTGNAIVPARLINEIDWNSHTSATRQLLQAIFPRRVLATHSLTGKSSPAFINKPPKKILDPKLVDDIVKTVASRCGVPKNLVRNSITIKCTDEAKLYRNRQSRHAHQVSRQNVENIPPSTPSSDE